MLTGAVKDMPMSAGANAMVLKPGLKRYVARQVFKHLPTET